ncbi:aa3-type cytochrome c oxidase subunit IV [Litorivita sp. NS0012-18]
MAEHKHGEMDIEVQEKTFEGFMKASAWVAGASVFILIILALFNS